MHTIKLKQPNHTCTTASKDTRGLEALPGPPAPTRPLSFSRPTPFADESLLVLDSDVADAGEAGSVMVKLLGLLVFPLIFVLDRNPTTDRSICVPFPFPFPFTLSLPFGADEDEGASVPAARE